MRHYRPNKNEYLKSIEPRGEKEGVGGEGQKRVNGNEYRKWRFGKGARTKFTKTYIKRQTFNSKVCVARAEFKCFGVWMSRANERRTPSNRSRVRSSKAVERRRGTRRKYITFYRQKQTKEEKIQKEALPNNF